MIIANSFPVYNIENISSAGVDKSTDNGYWHSLSLYDGRFSSNYLRVVMLLHRVYSKDPIKFLHLPPLGAPPEREKSPGDDEIFNVSPVISSKLMLDETMVSQFKRK